MLLRPAAVGEFPSKPHVHLQPGTIKRWDATRACRCAVPASPIRGTPSQLSAACKWLHLAGCKPALYRRRSTCGATRSRRAPRRALMAPTPDPHALHQLQPIFGDQPFGKPAHPTTPCHPKPPRPSPPSLAAEMLGALRSSLGRAARQQARRAMSSGASVEQEAKEANKWRIVSYACVPLCLGEPGECSCWFAAPPPPPLPVLRFGVW